MKYSLDNQLFNFDVESKPIVEVLVGKVLEQSLLEVMQEEELASLKERQKMFEEARAVELQEEQRLEEEEKRRKKEKVSGSRIRCIVFEFYKAV